MLDSEKTGKNKEDATGSAGAAKAELTEANFESVKDNTSLSLVVLKMAEERKNRASGIKEPERESFLTFAYVHLASRIPVLPGFRHKYERSGISQVYEAYMSRALLTSMTISAGCFALFVTLGVLSRSLLVMTVLSAFVLSLLAFGISFFTWLLYPLQKQKSMKQSLENKLAFSIGILSVLSSAGMGVEDLFERVSALDTNPVLSDLSKRFLRNIKVFGMDTASALREVSLHCPSSQFSRFLDSIEVAFQTRGSLHDLVSFESQRLMSEKRDRLRKSANDLSIMAELYVSLVVVMPIFFIVMFVIFELLPKVTTLPPATLMTNALLFIGVPVISAIFIITLDTMVQRT